VVMDAPPKVPSRTSPGEPVVWSRSYKESQRILNYAPGAIRFCPRQNEALELPRVIAEAAERAEQRRPRTLEGSESQASTLSRKLSKPIPMPNSWRLREARRKLAPITKFTSPVFVDLSKIPKNVGTGPGSRPILFIGNHTIYGLTDIPFFVDHYLNKRGVLVRALAHPLVFAAGQTGAGTGIESLGSLKVSPRNLYRLLANGNSALMFPGGSREACKRKGEAYQLRWGDAEEGNGSRGEFTRMVLRAGGLIVPFGAVGAEDNWEIMADGDELVNAPVLGGMLKKQFDKMGLSSDPARRWKNSDSEGSEENYADFMLPLARPKAMSRMYFKFGDPIDPLKDWSGSKGSGEEREHCSTLFKEVKASVEKQMDDLLRLRSLDDFENTPKRLLFEQASDVRAPTAWRWSNGESNFE